MTIAVTRAYTNKFEPFVFTVALIGTSLANAMEHFVGATRVTHKNWLKRFI
jgi:hypothetical protein